LLPTAFPGESKIERINEQGLRTVVDVDLSAPEGRQFQVRNGDRIEINPVLDQLENVVLTEGHLQRPGGFQWREGLRVSDVISSVSTLLPNPDLQYALVVRQQQPTRTSIVLKLELGNAIANPGSSADVVLQANDRIITFGNTESRQENLEGLLQELNAQASFNNPAAVVTVQGNVRFPGEYPYLENMSVGDMLNSAGGLLENSDERYALMVKKKNNQGAIEIEDAIGNTLSINSGMNATRGDMLLVFEANAPRGELLVDVVTQLKSQSDSIERSRVVRISGQVRFPGEYPLYEGMTIKGLLRAAGGFTESALTSEAELTRYFVQEESGRQVDHLDVNLQSEGVLGQNLRLAEFDSLMIKQLSNWSDTETIQISGEVVSPGVYSVSKGELLSSIIKRAGGLTEFADPNASVLLRATLREQERELLEEYERELQADIAAVALEDNGEDNQEGMLAVGENLLDQVESAEPLGRLAFDMQRLLSGNQDEDVIVRNGDQLFIPRTRQEVSIMGEVGYPTSHLFNPELSVADYIDLSGGLTQRSDVDRTYIIKANGQVVAYDSSRWFFERETALGTGDTIVVPFDVEPVDYLVTWSSVSQILFNLATSVLAIESVNRN
jgi:polysaccharide export outer membrane protein